MSDALVKALTNLLPYAKAMLSEVEKHTVGHEDSPLSHLVKNTIRADIRFAEAALVEASAKDSPARIAFDNEATL